MRHALLAVVARGRRAWRPAGEGVAGMELDLVVGEPEVHARKRCRSFEQKVILARVPRRRAESCWPSSGATTLAACGGGGDAPRGWGPTTPPAELGFPRSPPRTRRGSAAATGSPTPRASRGPSIRGRRVDTLEGGDAGGLAELARRPPRRSPGSRPYCVANPATCRRRAPGAARRSPRPARGAHGRRIVPRAVGLRGTEVTRHQPLASRARSTPLSRAGERSDAIVIASADDPGTRCPPRVGSECGVFVIQRHDAGPRHGALQSHERPRVRPPARPRPSPTPSSRRSASSGDVTQVEAATRSARASTSAATPTERQLGRRRPRYGIVFARSARSTRSRPRPSASGL